MNLEQQMREKIRAFLDREGSLFELRDWLEDHVQAVADDNGPVVREIDSQTWHLIAEFDEGWINEDEVRAELKRRLYGTRTVRIVWSQERGTVEAEPDVVISTGAS